MADRPLGITILSILIGLAVVFTLLTSLDDLQINLVLGFLDLLVIVFGSIAIYGMWELKTWGWKAGIAYAIIDIVISGLMTFVFVDLILDSIAGFDLNLEIYRSTLLGAFVFALIIDLIVIYYVYAKKEIFTN